MRRENLRRAKLVIKHERSMIVSTIAIMEQQDEEEPRISSCESKAGKRKNKSRQLGQYEEKRRRHRVHYQMQVWINKLVNFCAGRSENR